MYKILWLFITAYLKDIYVFGAVKVECGYKQCPQTRDGALNVHLIAHSHMDAGWVKTFDEYYYGSKTAISSANVQLIYHSVLSELLHDKRRKFTFSESAYFWRWWKEQRPATRATFRSLVQEGRIEFAGGGWVQSDEATTDYLMLLDQYTWGLRKLNDTLGPCGKPKAAWQIDSYGHTREHASLLAQMGYDGLFIGRVDHNDREAMLEEDRMEFMWRGSDVLGKMSDIMTHTLYNLYNAPDGFCFDFLCNEEPIVDDVDNRMYNAVKRVNDFISQIERQAKYYEHDNIMVTMGGDFTYQSAANWFINIDKLINHVNMHPANMSDINIFYSTPSCYLKALYLYGRRDKAIYTERGEHIPYGSDATTYWTGYYTSRPSTKYLARQAHAFLQVVKQLTVIARMGDSYELHLLRHAVALMMHHDAITGTSQQHVANDFVRLVSDAFDACAKKVSNLLSYLTPTWGGTRRSKNHQQFTTCHQMNLSQCKFAETYESSLVIVYNPLSVKTYYYVRLPAIALHYSVRNPNDEEVEYQLIPLPTAVINLPGRSSNALQELVFEAENIPPLGYLAYYITPVRDQLEENEFSKKQKAKPELEIVSQITNEYLKVSVNQDTGLLESVQHVDGIKVMVDQNFYFYSQGRSTLQSGAYSFRPNKGRPTPVVQKVSYSCIRGTLVKEIRQRFTDWIHQTLRIYRGEEFLELEWVIGPVPIGTDLGKEIVTLFSTNISNRGDFYTDSNGRQMIKRSCWNETASRFGSFTCLNLLALRKVTSAEKKRRKKLSSQTAKKSLASCYYPVTSRLCIHSFNGTTGLCVLPDRSQGGTSYNEGEVELMVHRRLLTDDGFGLDETLNEEENGAGLIIRGKHRLYFGNYRQEAEELTFSERVSQAAVRWQMEPWQFLTSGEKINRRKWQNVRNKRFSALRLHGLPRHVRVLTLEPWKVGSVLLRLENTLEKGDKVSSSKAELMTDEFPKPTHISVELRKVFQHLQIRSVRETTLGANQWLEEARQMDWSTRYVYSGGDDGILAEDVDYMDDGRSRLSDRKDPDHYSDEEPEYSRRKSAPKQHSEKVKAKLRMYNVGVDESVRRKRSVNISENVIDNVLNHSDKNYNLESNRRTYTTEKTKSNEKITRKSEDTDNSSIIIMSEHEFIKSTEKDLVTNTPKSGLYRLLKKHTAEYGSVSSEEEFLNMRKQSRRKKGRKKRPAAIFAEMHADETDDGVTKSIYEMYYKTKAKLTSFKPLIRTSEEVTEPVKVFKKKKSRRFRSKEFEERLEESTRRSKKKKRKQKKVKVDMPFFLNGAKTEASEELSTEAHRAETFESEEEKVEDDDDEGDDDEHYARRKRATHKDQVERASEEPEAEYVVTLRPTQIRTFVVRFQSNKKHYVI